MKIDIECKSCGGTGLYVGMAERDGAAVICSTCNGTGKQELSYTPFTKRKERTDIVRVYSTGGGYVITPKDIVVDGKDFPFSTAGCTYKEWLNGVTPKPITFLGCPMRMMQWECHQKKGFIAKCEKLNDGYIFVISACKHQHKKAECWKRFELG